MNATSHFIWIELKSELFSDVFVNIYKYLKENKIENIVSFQNPLSIHITIYYFGNNLNKEEKSIKNEINKLDLSQEIYIKWVKYFYKWKWRKSLLFFESRTNLNILWYRNLFHKIFNRDYIENNKLEFSPHITFFRILNSNIFEKHRVNIEEIITSELQKINNLNISNKKAFLYAVNSEFKEEIQLKI